MRKILVLAFIASFVTTTYAKQNSPHCTVDGQPIIFGSNQSDNLGIVTKVAIINEDLSLLFHYNMFYDIGGSVELRTPNRRVSLLRWDTSHETNIYQSSIIEGIFHIDCQMLEP